MSIGRLVELERDEHRTAGLDKDKTAGRAGAL